MRSPKYLNAREYAEQLYLSDNRDVQDFAREFIEALDFQEDSELSEIREKLDDAVEDEKASSYLDKVAWLKDEAETLAEIEEKIQECLPEFKDKSIEDIIPDMLKRLRPVQEFDL